MPFSTAAFDPLSDLRIADSHLEAALRGREFLILDGAMGTMLQEAGLAVDGAVPDLLNLTHPQQIADIHRAYVEAGSQAITTNTFGANRSKLAGRATVAEVFEAAAACARAAGARYVAGDIGPSGCLLAPMGPTSFEEAYELFAEEVRAADEAGCDLIVIETMSDLLEAKAAVLAARENCDLPILATMTFEEDGRTFLGTPPDVAACVLAGLGASAVGVNCSLGPAEMMPVVRTLLQSSPVPVVVQPNAGLPRMVDGATVYDVTPGQFGAAMREVVASGACVLGGCCGTSPDFIREVVREAETQGAPVKRDVPNHLVIASASRALTLHEGSAEVGVIGERINPTGKPKLKAALREGRLDYLVGEAVNQQNLGADLLDVNVGLPELDEPETLHAAVQTLSSTCTLPLVLDSSDPEALERAARDYAGKPLINSVNGKRDNLAAVLPIAAKYGCSVIGLTLDEDGIPATAEERFGIAQRIVAEAARYGIPARDVVIDCLTMAAATNQREAAEILKAIRMVKSRLGCRCTLGVSNISFGLPQRPLMNSNFLAAAFGAGLDLPILNPKDARYRDAVACYRVINAQDEGAREYIERCRNTPDPYEGQKDGTIDADKAKRGAKLILEAVGVDVARTNESSAVQDPSSAAEEAQAGQPVIPVPDVLRESAAEAARVQDLILSGRGQAVADATRKLLERHDGLDLINCLFIPCLDEVGLRFDDGRFFLPQLMASAEAVKAGFDVVRDSMSADGGRVAGPDRPVILATVRGDIHDIGKNIVKMLLENYGFRVIDLGRDVPPEDVVETARDRGVKLVGLSALMTTTVKAMEETIRLLHEQLPDVKVFVGGAVLTPEYARTIGADFYTKDAAASARVAERFYAEAEGATGADA